jgi:hypothetical protein
MRDPSDSVPAYQAIRIGVLESPVAQLADTEAWQARERYPEIVSVIEPVFFVTQERELGGWELVSEHGGAAPQEARDAMASHFRKLAHEAEQAGDEAVRDAWMKAATRLDWEPLDELTVCGTRFRVVRAELYIRTGPAGPEPPRPSDPDPGQPDEADRIPDPTAGFVIDPTVPTGMSEGIFKADLLSLGPMKTAPAQVREHAKKAQHTHPGCVLLPAAFLIAGKVNKKWGSAWLTTWSSPQKARDFLADHLRICPPWKDDLPAEARARHRAVADQFSEERSDSLSVDGHQYRIVRVERFVRIGPDGPEGPRPSDPDPYPPPAAQAEQLRGQDIDAFCDEPPSAEARAEAERYIEYMREEQQRREERIARRAARRANPRPPSY